MDAKTFRELALAHPGATEGEHMDHPDFRVRGKIFASLTAGEKRGVVALTADQQLEFLASAAGVFVPAAGAWGRQGWTEIDLKAASRPAVSAALDFAWTNKAPKNLLNPKPSATTANKPAKKKRAAKR